MSKPDWKPLLSSLPGYDPYADADGCWFDQEAAQLYLDFFPECLTHVEGDMAGKPFKLEWWQQAFIANLFGWKKKDLQGRDVRRYRECLLYLPRKQGKTPMIAGLAIAVYFLDGERGQQIEIGAENREQAGKLFRHCRGMIEAEPELSNRCRVYGGTAAAGQSKSLVRHDDPVSYLRIVAADAGGQHGSNLSLGIVDELHTQPNRDMVDAMQTSTASANRKNPLLIWITTADFKRESICNEKYYFACKVCDGVIAKQNFLPVIFEATEQDDWTSEEVWRKANPNLGVSVSLEYLRSECERAKEIPAYENTFRRLHLNQQTETDVRAIPMDKWDAVASNLDPIAWRKQTIERLKVKECWAGLDLGSTSDLTAVALLFREGGVYTVLPYFWCAKEGARKRERRDRVPYETWARQEFVTLTEGDVTDYDRVRKDINNLSRWFFLKELAVDRWNATQIVTQLQNDGANVIAYGQGFRDMAAPTKSVLELVIGGQLENGGNPVLRWMASNASTETDAAGNLKFSKKKSTEKIDGIIAMTMALGRAMADNDSGGGFESW